MAKKDWWPRFKKSFNKNFIDFLMLFAAEDKFIHNHKHKSSMIAEQNRYGNDKDHKKEQD